MSPATRALRSGSVLVGLVVLLAACTSGGQSGGTRADGAGGGLPGGVETADGWSIEVLRADLKGPTQLAVNSDGQLHVAELAGPEDAGVGRVRRLGADGTSHAAVLVEDLRAPTGLQVPGRADLLVQEQQRLIRLTDGTPEVLVGDLPFNGRSQGTLTLVPPAERGLGPAGFVEVLAVATGTGSGPDPAPGSGVLYALVSGADGDLSAEPERRPVAVGFKNAYAHAFGPEGELYVTEVGDGTYDGERPPDELNVIPADVWQAALTGDGQPFDGGWPDCTGDGDPTEEFGATSEGCASLPGPVALFPPQSTPTSVAVAGDGRVLVTLWVEDRVVEVDPDTGEVTVVVTGLDRPQHLLARGDGSFLLTVHGSGHLLRLVPPS